MGEWPPPARDIPSLDEIRYGKRAFRLDEMDREAIDTRALTDRGRTVLAMEEMDWKHAQTDHFVVHYQKSIFARKVAKMAEFFYDYIADELKAVEDHVSGRSHIFVFDSSSEWEAFIKTANVKTEWAFSLVAGTVMYLQQAGNTKRSGSVLAHEMTHLVLNRFFPGQPPIWLNEGLAEWYEEFAYSAFKGTKKSKRPQFRRMRYRMKISSLVASGQYPSTDREIWAFYETAKFLVGFLMLEWKPEKIVPFTEDMIAGMSAEDAFQKHYRIASLEELAEEFDDFVR
jgi:hypothetical protein